MMGKKGFTLVELAVVIAVMTILIGAVITSYSALRREAVINNIVGFVGDFQKAMYRFQSIYGRFPQSLEDNQFVPRFLLDFRNDRFIRNNGFKPDVYNPDNSACGNKPTISIEVYDGSILQELQKRLDLCDDSTHNKVIIRLVP